MIGKIRSRNQAPHEGSYHVVLTPFWEPCSGKAALPGTGQRVTKRVAWPLMVDREGVVMTAGIAYNDLARLSSSLLSVEPKGHGLTVWLPRGWEDFVGSGLADVVDRGDYRYRWACLDGPRVLFAGRLGKRPLNITSLSAWTGGAWDAWRDQAWEAVSGGNPGFDPTEGMDENDPNADDLLCALGSVLTVLGGCNVLRLGKPKLSIGAQARAWWQSWGGLAVRVAKPARDTRKARKVKPSSLVTMPLTKRPAAARGHEGHVCHGLAREQYYRGHVDGPVHVLDMASAYLIGIAAGAMPGVYYKTVRTPSPSELWRQLSACTGCALVRLERTNYPYPVYQHSEPARAVGSYWCWLAGVELSHALGEGTVAECQLAHLWLSARYDARSQDELLGIAPAMEESGFGYVKPFWRGLYAACVGGWAQRRWAWEDVDQPSQVGRWATWTMAGSEPDQLERWRVVAGRVQRRVYKGEAPHALPLAYACVVAAVRRQLDTARLILPDGSVLATACDALWVTEEGHRAVEGKFADGTLSQSLWRWKDRFDDAWLDGRGGAVVRKGAYRYPLLPGVPHGVCIEEDGKARWERSTPWTDGIGGGNGEPRRRRVATWDGGALMHRNSGPLAPVSPWLTLHDTILPESLLLPYDPAKVRRRRKGESHDEG